MRGTSHNPLPVGRILPLELRLTGGQRALPLRRVIRGGCRAFVIGVACVQIAVSVSARARPVVRVRCGDLSGPRAGCASGVTGRDENFWLDPDCCVPTCHKPQPKRGPLRAREADRPVATRLAHPRPGPLTHRPTSALDAVEAISETGWESRSGNVIRTVIFAAGDTVTCMPRPET